MTHVVRCCLSTDAKRISKVNAATGILSKLVENSGNDILAAADGKIYFTDDDSGSLQVYNSATQSTTSIPVLDLNEVEKKRVMQGIARHPTNGRMYVIASQLPRAGIYSVDSTGATATVKLLNISADDNLGPGQYEWKDIGIAQYLAFNKAGDLLFSAYRNSTIYKWSTPGQAPAPVNNGTGAAPSDGALLRDVRIGPVGLAINAAGDMLVSSPDIGQVWMVQAGSGKLKLVAGSDNRGSSVDPGDALNSRFQFVRGVAFGPGGDSFFVADDNNHRVVRVLLKCTMV
jgi:sugar lactone lactonase YvrE